MSDKSPRQGMTKKSKSIKEKRSEKREKSSGDESSAMDLAKKKR